MFEKIWRGWAIGASVLSAPVWVIAVILRSDIPDWMLVATFLIPLAAAVQGIAIAGIVCLGHKIWTQWRLREYTAP